MVPGYLVLAALAVPAGTFTGLWFWRLRPGLQRRGDTGAPGTEADIAQTVAAMLARQRYLQAQVADAWETRERRLAAQVADLIESAGAAAEKTILGLGGPAVPDRREPGP